MSSLTCFRQLVCRHRLTFSQLVVIRCLHGRLYHVKRGFYSSEIERSVNDTDGHSPETISDSDTDEHVSTTATHIPVMLDEVLDIIKPKDGQLIVDMTFGGGGHSRGILARAPNAKILALDRDPEAYSRAVELAKTYKKGQITPLLGRFSDLHHLLPQFDVAESSVDSILFDVGASSMQFDVASRGFSLSHDGPLDMRMDGARVPDQITAADVVNNMDESDLHDIIHKYGEENLARKIANMIVETRYAFGKITSTQQLADVVASVFEGDHRRDKLRRQSHVATKTFQALRIFVNNEVNELNNGLEVAHRFLKPGGTCVVLSFHSLEDRIVKRHFHGIDMDARHNMSMHDYHRNPSRIYSQEVMSDILSKRWQPVSKKVTTPSYTDSLRNPRARSAKLRAALKLEMDST